MKIYYYLIGVVILNIPKVILGLDPGQTTGWAVFTNLKRTACGELASKKLGMESSMKDLIDLYTPDLIFYEDYKVYKDKADIHIGAVLFTPFLIGCIRMYAFLNNIPVISQMAGTVKPFVTNDKLKTWGFYKKGIHHSLDAHRHIIWGVIFSKDLILATTNIPENRLFTLDNKGGVDIG